LSYAKIFKQMTRIMIKVIQTPTLILSATFQYWMTIDAADISAHRVMAELYQFCRGILALSSSPRAWDWEN